MNLITARWNIPFKAGPLSASTIFTMPVNGPILGSVAVFSALESFDTTKVGVRILDKGGRQIYPALGQADQTAVIAGRGSWAPILPKGSGFWVDHLGDELSGSPYELKFDFYNEDAADFIALVYVLIGQDTRPLAVHVGNFNDLIQPIGGLIQGLIERVFPKG